MKGSAAAQAGIEPGDLVRSIDGEAITDFQQLPQIISVSGGQTLAITLARGTRLFTVDVAPRRMQIHDVLGNRVDSYVIGVSAPANPKITTKHYSPAGAFMAACGESWTIVKTTMAGIWQMVRGYAGADQFQGPLGIARMTGQVAAFGFLALINLAAVLSVSIGLANLFPIPLLDGGHLLYYACEAVLGRPLGERVQDVGFRLGLVLVLGLMLLATWNDIARLNLF
jgi:regulator of sigma E protease